MCHNDDNLMITEKVEQCKNFISLLSRNLKSVLKYSSVFNNIFIRSLWFSNSILHPYTLLLNKIDSQHIQLKIYHIAKKKSFPYHGGRGTTVIYEMI